MNKYIKIITALFLLMSYRYGLSMQQRPIIKMPSILERGFCEKQKALQHLRRQQGDVYAKARKIASLEKKEQERVVNNLSKQEKTVLLTKMTSQERENFYFVLFNQNEKIVGMCRHDDPAVVVEKYTKAKQRVIDYPIRYCGKQLEVQHYMFLTEGEVQSFSDIHNKKFFFERDVENFMSASEWLQRMDPALEKFQAFTHSITVPLSWRERPAEFKYSKSFTDLVKQYPMPSRSIEVALYRSIEVNSYCSAMLRMIPMIWAGLEIYSSVYPTSLNLKGIFCLLIGSTALIAEVDKHCKYKKIIEDRAMPRMPLLTDILHGEGSREKGECKICCCEQQSLMHNIPCNNDKCLGTKGEFRICWDCYSKIQSPVCPFCRATMRILPMPSWYVAPKNAASDAQ